MSRITLNDTTTGALMKMSDGNPGAAMALMEILQKHKSIDPQAILGGLGALMMLDTWEIYGTNIYVLFNDKCGRDVRKMLILMRATQLGIFPHHQFQKLAADQTRLVNLSDQEWKDLDDAVCEQLEDFSRTDKPG